MIKIQRYHIIFSFLFIFLGLNAQEEGHIPTAIFKAIFWDKFTSKNLSYAPWGNHNDKNATMVSLQVGFSTVSRPFVYYGSSPVKFFEKIYQPETSSDYTISDQTKKELGGFSFEKATGQTRYFLLLFLKQASDSKFKIFPLSLSSKELEFGSFKIYSQCKENLYLAYGDQKQVLAPGKSVKFRGKEEEDFEAYKLRVFTKNGSKYEETATDYLAFNKDKRAFIFLSPFRNRIKVKRYYVDRIDIEKSLGYGMSPLANKSSGNLDENSSIRSLPPLVE